MIQGFDNREGKIWLNGKLVEWNDSKIHVLNHGLHYASSVFEGERAYNGKIFKSEEHTQRFFEGAQTMDMKIPFTQSEILNAKKELIISNGLKDAYVRPIAWRGSEMMAVSAQKTTINVAIASWAWPSYFDPSEKMKGIKLDIAKWKRPDPNCAPVHVKASGLYMICTLSKHDAEAKGYSDALMLDWRDLIAEATGANIFFKFVFNVILSPGFIVVISNYLKLFKHILHKIHLYLDNKEDQDGSEASVFVKSLLSLYPVISIDHNFAENPSPFLPALVSL